MSHVAVIVVTFNHADHIAACLASLRALSPAAAEVILVDNGSSDGTVARARACWPELRIVEPGRNLGFAGGCNLGVELSSAPLVALANPDLVVRPSWLAELVSPLAEHPQVAITGSKLLKPDGRTIQHAGASLRMPLMLGHHHGAGEIDAGQLVAPRLVEYVTGAALACRRATWQKLDGLDEGFWPAYYEEADLCLRARAAGWEVLYVPASVATHVEAAGLGRHSERFFQLFHRNRLRLLFKHQPAAWLVERWLPAELAYLRSVASDVELAALTRVYLAHQRAALLGGEADLEAIELPAEATADGQETELHWVGRQLAGRVQLRHVPPTARHPLVARLRRGISRLLVAADLAPLIEQQSAANAAMAEAIAALTRQRRAADAAVLAQAVLLARLSRPAG